ncbi:MAG: HupE/UreJ family protein [Myxococcota bacterium]
MIRALFLVLCTLGGVPRTASAHESRPLYVEIEETEPFTFEIRSKAPTSVGVDNLPTVSLPNDCPALSGSAARPRSRSTKGRFRCDFDLAGRTIDVDYRLFNPSVSTLVRVKWLSGATHTTLETPKEATVTLPKREGFGSVAREYSVLGFRHILEGYDHLLFLVCLLIIAGTGRRILVTVTGFTVAHSITLALSALGKVSIPLAPVEAAIALSIVFLAVEIARDDRESLAFRYPITVASSFGLLHGFGFAAVLGETGLPQTEVRAALLFFNLGVEVGQLAFIGAVLVAFWLVSRASSVVRGRAIQLEDLRRLDVPAAYAVGILASYWMFERIAGFWTS